MILPADSVIEDKKVRDYLLVPQSRNDKSQFLERAGYVKEEWEKLVSDIRSQLLPHEAVFQETTRFADFYTITGDLKGPNGNLLKVKSVWGKDKTSSTFRFITLIPQRRKRE